MLFFHPSMRTGSEWIWDEYNEPDFSKVWAIFQPLLTYYVQPLGKYRKQGSKIDLQKCETIPIDDIRCNDTADTPMG